MREGLRLRLFHKPDPVLDETDLEIIQKLLGEHIGWASDEMSKHLVSESIIRSRMEAEIAKAKIDQVLESMR